MALPNLPEKSAYELIFLVERFEDTNAVLKNEIAGEIRWPIRLLPEAVKTGDQVTLKIASPKVDEQEKMQNMQKLLEDLIN